MSLLSITDVVVTRSAASNSPWPCLVEVACWESTLREHSRPVRVVERCKSRNETGQNSLILWAVFSPFEVIATHRIVHIPPT
jgi:hypothetical protein